MGFFEAINSVFAGFFRFSGRASRSEYWWFFLFEILIISALAVVDFFTLARLFAQSSSDLNFLRSIDAFDLMLVYYSIVTFFPRMTVTVRRLHDVGLSGLFYLLYFIPIVGGLVIFVMTLMPSETDDNIHGPIGRGPRIRTSGNSAQSKPSGKHDPMQGYACLFKVDTPVTADMKAARKAEVRALYEQRVLGKGALPAE